MHPLLRYALIATPLAILAFLASSDFFSSWDGRAISRRASTVEDPATVLVLIVHEDRTWEERWWPAETVEALALPVDNTGVPPTTLPDQAAATLKAPLQLFFTVSPPEGTSLVVPTTSARALSTAVLLWLLGLALHNMWRSGSPFSVEARAAELPAPLPASGQAANDAPAAARSRKGPPPPKRRRGAGRRS